MGVMGGVMIVKHLSLNGEGESPSTQVPRPLLSSDITSYHRLAQCSMS